MKRFLLYTILMAIVITGYLSYANAKKILPFYKQLTQERIGTEVNLQSVEQGNAHYVGASKCVKCHEGKHKAWSHSGHPKMIRDWRKDPSVVVADFAKLPKDANFKLEDSTYTIGGKFKQRFMIRKDYEGKEDYVLGNYQWNVQTDKWQKFKPWKY